MCNFQLYYYQHNVQVYNQPVAWDFPNIFTTEYAIKCTIRVRHSSFNEDLLIPAYKLWRKYCEVLPFQLARQLTEVLMEKPVAHKFRRDLWLSFMLLPLEESLSYSFMKGFLTYIAPLKLILHGIFVLQVNRACLYNIKHKDRFFF